MLNTATLAECMTTTRAGTANVFGSAGSIASVSANTPRFDFEPVSKLMHGLLVEDSRTNIIRNNSMVGASQGVSPTYWSIPWTTTNGITWTFVGVGNESGIPYIDMRLSGTASAQSYLPISIETPGALTPGQTYTLSGYVRLVAGSLTGGTYGVGEGLRFVETLSSGGPIYNGTNLSTITNAALVSQRVSVTKVIDALTTSVNVSFQVPVASGQTIDATFRIGAPQLELGTMPSAPILTTSAQVTRNADAYTVTDLSKLRFNQNEGTVYIEAVVPAKLVAGTYFGLFSFTTGAANTNSFGLYVHGGTRKVNTIARVSGTATRDATSSTITLTPGYVFRVALTYTTTGVTVCVNGEAPWAFSHSMPTALDRLRIGQYDVCLNSQIRSFQYTARAKSPADLQAMTTLPSGPTLAFDFVNQTYVMEHI